MRSFEYTVRDALGIHARPAGLLVKLAKTLDSEITLSKGDRWASATRLMALMNLGIGQGDVIRITLQGGDEDASEKALRAFFNENL